MAYADDGPAIETQGLTKSYGGRTALAGVDLMVGRGTVLALLGPNGAGKTTTVRILATLTRPTSGTARVAGHDVVRGRSAVRRAIGLTGQFTAVDDGQTGRENLVMAGRLAGLPRRRAAARADELLERVDLADDASRRLAGYSGGMRRRLDLAAGLLVRPEVMFLDEPTTGLDPRSRQQTWALVADLAAGGTTVLLTTQYLDEADRLADRIAVLDGGRIVAEGSASQLKAQVGEGRLALVLTDDEAFDIVGGRLGRRALRPDRARRTVEVATDGSAADVRGLLDELDPTRDVVASFAVHTATLDDVFFALVGARQQEVRHG